MRATRIHPATFAKMKERDLQTYGTQLLELDGWRHLRTDPVSDRTTVNAIRQAIFNDREMMQLPWMVEKLKNLISRCVRGKGFGEKGMADDLYIRYDVTFLDGSSAIGFSGLGAAQVLWIEWKREGGEAKQHQREWIAQERLRGALVWLAGEDFQATPEAFFAHYQASGLMRKSIT